jgi:hypothetical protein
MPRSGVRVGVGLASVMFGPCLADAAVDGFCGGGELVQALSGWFDMAVGDARLEP